MKKKVYQMNGYKLHLFKTNKFRRTAIKIFFKRPTIKEEMTIRSLLFYYLDYSTKKYPTFRELNIAEEDLYGAWSNSNVSLSGKLSIGSIAINVLNEKYTEPGMFDQGLNFFLDFILNPNFNSQKANPKILKIIKKDQKNDIKLLYENKERYTFYQMLDNLNENINHYPSQSYLEDFAKITPKNLFKYYQTIFDDEIDVYLVGDIDFQKVRKIFQQRLNLTTRNNQYRDVIYYHQGIKKEPSIMIDTDNVTQSNLAIAYKLINLTDYERTYVGPVANAILGGSADSQLFKIIREQQSLAYSIYSYYAGLINLLYIQTAISSSNYEQTINSINHIIKNITQGQFTNTELAVAKKGIITRLKESGDSPFGLIRTKYQDSLVNIEEVNEQIKKIKGVTKNDIISFCHKLILDNIYLLKEVDHEEKKH